MSEAADIPVIDEEQAKARSLATRKFDFEDMINADPQCPMAALKIVRFYLRFVTDFDRDAPFASIMSIQAATGLSTRTIIDTRNKLVEIGHFQRKGKTERGAERFKLSFAQENRVLDHLAILQETLKERDEERKAKQRAKRQAAASCPVTEQNAVTDFDDVTERNAVRDADLHCRIDRPVTERNAGDYLEEYLEGFSSEEEKPIQGSAGLSGYGSASGEEDEEDYVFPVPADDAEADQMMAEILDGVTVAPAIETFFRKKLMAGDLRKSMIEQQRRLAA
jgi:hypothetical protein